MADRPPALTRVVGVPGAVLMGLGSIVGTGVFVSIGVAAGVAGPSVVLATALAALVATFNGLSSAQLAALHPVSGGTYEYGHRWLTPSLGFVAGWMFLAAKSASAATAALGLAGYLLSSTPLDAPWARVALALLVVAVLTALVAGGMQRSSRANATIVAVTLIALVLFVVVGLPRAVAGAPHFRPFLPDQGVLPLLHATALMFVAYTGYGRIATLGEEILEPARNIPRAIIVTLVVSMALYVAVSVVSVGTLGAPALAEATRAEAAPLAAVSHTFGLPPVSWLLSAAAVTAMAGVLLNLLLGLSRVTLSMARRRDLPTPLARIENGSPQRAVVAVGALVGLLVLAGDVKATWTFSAFTVLIYYALTNLAALRLDAHERRYPRWVAGAGLLSCLSLAFFVPRSVWLVGLALIAAGLSGRFVARRMGF